MYKSKEGYRFAGMHGPAAKVKLRNVLAEAQNWRCCYCCKELDQATVTLEHVIKGKRYEWTPDAKYNIVVACYNCNHAASRFKDGYEYFSYRSLMNEFVMSANAVTAQRDLPLMTTATGWQSWSTGSAAISLRSWIN